jgi:hypothetical protein
VIIARGDLEGMFESIRSGGAYDIDGPCLWSYFFTDVDRDKLLAAADKLEARGFHPIGFLEPPAQGDAQAIIFLRVDRIEAHSVDSLMALNGELDAFAKAEGLGSYDGMEVGSAAAGLGS